MVNRKWYEWALTLVYIAMIVLCIFLNFSPNHKESIATIVVNVLMFLIVGVIFLAAELGSFAKMNSIMKDLNFATEKIKMDAMNTHSYLWEPYHANNVELFRNPYLKELFRDFIFELNREYDAENKFYKPSIDDYINGEMVDTVMHRNELNQVPGMLTGLGILGTFIGLSLGLQNFNTGTTAEMTNSIEPLMNGIKVAFHTSIYGMIFSLTFNTIYKKKLFEAEETVNSFTTAFKKYVLPDTSYDGMNQLLVLQGRQIDAINGLASNLSDELADIITPHLDRIQETIVDFGNMATRNQAEAMSKIVEYFVAEMNKALSGSFWQINNSVEEMYKAQKNNSDLMQEVITAASQSTGNLDAVNRATENLVITLNNYSEAIQKVLNGLQATITNMNERDDAGRSLLEDEKDMLSNQQNIISEIKTAVEGINRAAEKSGTEVTEALMEMSDGMYLLRRAIDKQQQAKPSTRRKE